MTRHLAITGYYGFGNAGDDAILIAIAGRLVSHGYGLKVITYPDSDRERLVRETSLQTIDGRDLAAATETIAASEALLIGGGGLIQDYLPSDDDTQFTPRAGNLSFWTTMALIARTNGVPPVGFGLGVGPLSTEEGREQARRLFDIMSMIIVRDQPSADLVSRLGGPAPRIAADPAYLLEPAPTDPLIAGIDDLPTGGSRRVCVSVRSWGDDDRWQSQLAAGLDDLIARLDADVLLLPFQQSRKGLDNDSLAATRVAARMGHSARRAVIATELTPSEKAAVISASDLVIGMRLHSAIFAARAGVPVVGLAYDPKVRNAMEDLTVGDLCLDLGSLSAEAVAEAAERALALPTDRLDAYRDAAGRAVESARSAETMLMDFLESPQLAPVGDDAAGTLSRAAVLNANRLLEAERDRDSWHLRAVELADELEKSKLAYAKLAASFQEFMDARAVRAVRSLWSLRDKAKGAPEAVSRGARNAAKAVLPAPARRAVRSAIGPSAGPDTAETWTEEELARFSAEIEADLEHMVETHRDSPGFVVFPPGIGWEVELFQRPQQMALAFARLGYVVLYHVEDKFRDGLVGYERRADLLYTGYLPEPLLDLLHVVPSPIFPAYVYNFEWERHLTDPATVYEHIDDLEVFEHVHRRDDLRLWHRTALEHSDVVAASAVDLLGEIQANRPDAILVPNGVDFDHFATASTLQPPGDMTALTGDRPVIGYYGALAEWFDYDLIGHAARALPGTEFVLIGPDYDGTAASSSALEMPNVHWLGPRPYRELPAYLGRFDVATIPFVVNDVTHAVSPLKLFEYMAGGKAVATPPLRECARYRAVQIGEGAAGFVDALKRAMDLGRDPDHVDLLRHTARANTWDARVRKVIEAVETSRV